MAPVYTERTKTGRERYSGPATYISLGEAAIDLAWARRNEPPAEDDGAFGAWWMHSAGEEWWGAWMLEYQREAREVYQSALTVMRNQP